jgi:hypothetical protein
MANSSNLAFCLEYSNHKSDMIDAFDDYLKNENMVDVMLSCEGNTIKAHKMILSAGSTYFRNIFSAFKNPFQFPVLIIKDMPFKDLKAIVEFLYRGEVVVPVEQVSSLSKSAQSLYIKGLEKYFHKSAMVNVGNQSSNASISSNTTSNNAVNTSQSKSNSINNPKPSISMSLRKKRRPNYRQLSNGDFNSDESNSEDEQQSTQINKSDVIQIRRGPQTQVTYGRRSQVQLSKPIKSEIVFNENYVNERERVGPPLLEMQMSVGSDSYQIPANDENDDNANDSNDDENEDNEDNEDNEEEEEENDNNDDNECDVYQNESEFNASYSGAEYTEVEAQASTSSYGPSQTLTMNYSKGSNSKSNATDNRQSEPRGVIRNPIRIAPRRVKAPFMGRHPRRRYN